MRYALPLLLTLLAHPVLAQESWTIEVDSTYDRWSDRSYVAVRTLDFKTTNPHVQVSGSFVLGGDPRLPDRYGMVVTWTTQSPRPLSDLPAWQRNNSSFCLDYIAYGETEKRGLECRDRTQTGRRRSDGRLVAIHTINLEPVTLQTFLAADSVLFRRHPNLVFAWTPAFQSAFRAVADTVSRRRAAQQP